MKVLLVRYHDGANINTRLPKSLNRIRGVMPPLGLLAIAAYLEKRSHEVKVLDCVSERVNEQQFADYVSAYKPGICGVTSMLENYFGACKAAEIAKRYGCITVLGGPALEVYPQDAIDKDYLDFGVVGEGEETFLRLVQSIESDTKDFSKIGGLSYKINSGIIAGKPQFMPDLNTLPMAAYHLINVHRYSSLINDYPIITYLMGRGCPFNCSFCIKAESDKHIRFRSPALVAEDMQQLISRYKIKEFMFYDDTFTLSKRQINCLCDEILRRQIKVKFEAPTRVDNIIGLQEIALVRKLKKSGCYRLRLGVESGDPEVLKRMRKNIDLEGVELAFKRCKDEKIETFAYFMVGYLSESRASFSNTLKISKKINPDYVMFTIATPYPKTRLYEESLAEGKVPPDYWKDYITGKTKKRVPYLVPKADAWAKEAYRKFYFRPQYILKKLCSLRTKQKIKNAVEGFLGILLYGNG